MRITKKELEEFKQIYLEEFGIKLGDLEATKKALNLLTGIEMISDKPRVRSNPISRIDRDE